jgi:anti-sigma B factor antagonist
MTMEISERELDGVKVLDVKGKVLRGESEAMLRDRIQDLADRGYKRLVINLGGVPYIDSSGLGELVRCFRAMRRTGGRVGLTNLNHRVVDLFRITKLSDVFETYESEDAAIRSFRE